MVPSFGFQCVERHRCEQTFWTLWEKGGMVEGSHVWLKHVNLPHGRKQVAGGQVRCVKQGTPKPVLWDSPRDGAGREEGGGGQDGGHPWR